MVDGLGQIFIDKDKVQKIHAAVAERLTSSFNCMSLSSLFSGFSLATLYTDELISYYSLSYSRGISACTLTVNYCSQIVPCFCLAHNLMLIGLSCTVSYNYSNSNTIQLHDNNATLIMPKT